MSDHTQELWKLNHKTQIDIDKDTTLVIKAVWHGSLREDIAEAKAKRIVDCVNYCMAMSNEAISVTGGARDKLKEITELEFELEKLT